MAQIPSGFGTIQTSRRPSMLQVYLDTKKRRADEEEASFQRSRQVQSDARVGRAEVRAEEAHESNLKTAEVDRMETLKTQMGRDFRFVADNPEMYDQVDWSQYEPLGMTQIPDAPPSPEHAEQLRAMSDRLLGAEKVPTDVQTFDTMAQGLSEEEIDRARRIELGLSPRAVGNANITLASGAAGVTPEEVGGAAGTVKGGEEAGKQAIEMSGEAMEKLQGVRKSVTNIDNAIAAIDKGANTGAIASRLPSVQAASVELDNIRGQMGIDVLGAVTFGALSEGELAFALSTAMPDNLNEKELRKWLVRKKETQEKLADELEGAAIFLGTPGNTPAKYLEYMKSQGALKYEKEEAKPEPKSLSDMTDDELEALARGE